MSYYKNNVSSTTPDLVGTFPYPPYYWWESGGVWGAMVDYWVRPLPATCLGAP